MTLESDSNRETATGKYAIDGLVKMRRASALAWTVQTIAWLAFFAFCIDRCNP